MEWMATYLDTFSEGSGVKDMIEIVFFLVKSLFSIAECLFQ